MSKRRSRWRQGESNVGQHTAEQAGNFLFDLGNLKENAKEEEVNLFDAKALDQKTRVLGKNIMSALMFYDVLFYGYKSEASRVIGNTLKRLLIGHKGMGRDEAKTILTQSLPREIEIETGIAD